MQGETGGDDDDDGGWVGVFGEKSSEIKTPTMIFECILLFYTYYIDITADGSRL